MSQISSAHPVSIWLGVVNFNVINVTFILDYRFNALEVEKKLFWIKLRSSSSLSLLEFVVFVFNQNIG